MILSQFEISFVPLRAVKGQVVADFVAAHPILTGSPLNEDLPDEQVMSLEEQGSYPWELYFDGVASSHKDKASSSTLPGKAKIGLIFITPQKGLMRFS